MTQPILINHLDCTHKEGDYMKALEILNEKFELVTTCHPLFIKSQIKHLVPGSYYIIHTHHLEKIYRMAHIYRKDITICESSPMDDYYYACYLENKPLDRTHFLLERFIS